MRLLPAKNISDHTTADLAPAWPSWMKHFNTTARCGGMAPHARGIVGHVRCGLQRVFKREPRSGKIRVLFSRAGNSKSKLGMGVTERRTFASRLIAYSCSSRLCRRLRHRPVAGSLLRAARRSSNQRELSAMILRAFNAHAHGQERVLAFRLSFRKRMEIPASPTSCFTTSSTRTGEWSRKSSRTTRVLSA